MSDRSRNFWSLLAGLCLAFTLISCSSSSPEDEWAGEDSFFGEEDQAIVDGTGDDFSGEGDFSDFEDFGDFEDFEDIEVAEGDMDFSDFDDFDGGEGALAQELGDQDFGDDDFFFDEPTDEVADSFADPLADDAFGADAFADTGTDMADAAPVAPMASVDDFMEPAGDNFIPIEGDDFGMEDVAATSFDDPNSQMGLVPVKKIDSMPRHRGGAMLNAVYIGRPGDSVESVSQKIYGDDRSGELISHNPWLSDGFKVGEKLYYNSPNRPSDNTALLTYYEDVGTPAKTYVTGDSENIRVLSTELLGFDGAWKEVWATNFQVSSKDILPMATELKYWTDAAPTPSVSSPLAATPPPTDVLSLGMGFEPSPFPQDLTAANDLPPPPAAAPAGGSFDEFPDYAPSEFEDPISAQAPPLSPELNLPPPPVPQAGLASQSSSSSDSGDMTTVLLVALVGVALLLLVVSMAKKRRPVSMEYTQV